MISSVDTVFGSEICEEVNDTRACVFLFFLIMKRRARQAKSIRDVIVRSKKKYEQFFSKRNIHLKRQMDITNDEKGGGANSRSKNNYQRLLQGSGAVFSL